MYLLQTSYICFLLSLNIFEKVKYASKTISRIMSPLNLDFFFREIGIIYYNFFIPLYKGCINIISLLGRET
jgi:hypothetical protein